MMSDLEAFRHESREWLESHAPQGLRGHNSRDELYWGGRHPEFPHPDSKRWCEICAERGLTTPTWPEAYGGGGLSRAEERIWHEELQRLALPVPLTGFGLSMIGPTLLQVVGWDNRSSSFWPRSSDHFDHFGKHQSGIYMPQGPEFIRCDYPNPLPFFSMAQKSKSSITSPKLFGGRSGGARAILNRTRALISLPCRRLQSWKTTNMSSMGKKFGRATAIKPTGCSRSCARIPMSKSNRGSHFFYWIWISPVSPCAQFVSLVARHHFVKSFLPMPGPGHEM